MNLITHKLASFLLLCAYGISSAMAAASGNPITLTITFDLSDSLAIAWGDDTAGTNPADAQSWALTGIALNTVYSTHSTSTNPTGFKRFIVNESPTDTNTDVYVQISAEPTNWDAAAAAAQDAYLLKMSTDGDAVGGSTATDPANYDVTLTNNSQQKVFDLADNSAATSELDFLFHTPTSINNGANGSGLSIVVSFTATADAASAPTIITVTDTP